MLLFLVAHLRKDGRISSAQLVLEDESHATALVSSQERGL